MSHAVLELYAGSDSLFRVLGLKDEKNGSWADSNWTVKVTLYTDQGRKVSGQTWPESLSYESGSDGDFVGMLEDTLDVEPGDRLIGKLEVTSDLGYKASWEVPVEVVRREM